jgi:D-alanyl-D-alanine carboxypeptidase/D-alanyl-D-alanine-endopeptidase (penicillin-binding protein 4)
MSQFLRKAVLIISAILVAAGLAFSQSSPPVNTPAEVNRSQTAPIAGQTANPSATSALTQPAYLTPIGGFQGVLAETVEGSTIAAQSADERFNPASAVKLATALVALQSFGPEHRFMTGLWSTGTIDKSTGTLNGDLVVSGRDPSFHYEHAVMLARQLNDLGIRNVTGNLIVAPGFTMNFAWSAQRSGEDFLATLDSARRSGNATRAWLDERTLVGDTRSLSSVPSVVVSGEVLVGSAPAGAAALLTHKSSRLVDVLKALLCYSNNFMAERIGDMIGGPSGVGSAVTRKLGINPDEVALSSTSGLGINRVTPRAMMKILRGLRDELARNKLTLSDILPVAGVDPGTLEDRYTDPLERGSVIAKTGTLVRTDGGASALVGQMKTKSGRVILFVIMNQRGNVVRFRQNQDEIVAAIQNSLGGPAAFDYHPLALSMRLANSDYATAKSRGEYEPKD